MNHIKESFTKTVVFKVLIILGIILLLTIPKFKIHLLIKERGEKLVEAKESVGDIWGRSQVVQGPIFIVPYWKHRSEENGIDGKKEHLVILPEKLEIDGKVASESRNRGIYKVPVYKSDLQFTGIFKKPMLQKVGLNREDVIWEELEVLVSVSDLRGIRKGIELKWGDRPVSLINGMVPHQNLPIGLRAIVPLHQQQDEIQFSFNLQLNGTDNLSFVPVGSETSVTLVSDWNSPSFVGQYAPEERTIDQEGFKAYWNVLSLNRSFPQFWNIREFRQLDQTSFGVDLYESVDLYQQSERISKYSLLVIFLTFLTYFVLENLGKKPIHPVQYGMVGLGIIIFYSLLLSISEYLPFTWSYLIAASMIVATLGGYSATIFSSWKRGGIVALFVALLYLFVYIIVQAESAALLIGSFGLWFTLVLAMYFTRKIDWYKHRSGKSDQMQLERE